MPETNGSTLTDEQRKVVDQIVANVGSLLSRRSRFLQGQGQIDRRRDYNKECGYPDTREMTPWKYQELYDTEAIPARVVEFLPQECWQVSPRIYEDEDPDTLTAWEQALADTIKGLRLGSFYEGDEGNPLIAALKELDIKSGIGCYGVVLVGLDDGLPLSEPVKGVLEAGSLPVEKKPDGTLGDGQGGGLYSFKTNAAAQKGRKLQYLRVFTEAQAQVVQVEGNWASPRYGQPVMYQLTTFDPDRYATSGLALQPAKTMLVHWTRCVHVPSDTGGLPRMQQVLHQIENLRKIYGASAEGFWQAGFPITVIKTQPEWEGLDRGSIRDMMEAVRNGLQREMILEGADAQTLPPAVSDPTSPADIQITALCVKGGYPKRIFMGSEQGHRSSTQDDGRWNERVAERENNHCTAHEIVPLIDRLILCGVLPEPESGAYHVYWPDIGAQSDQEKATIAGLMTTALMAFFAGGGDEKMELLDFLTVFLELDQEEAKSIVDNCEALKKRLADETAKKAAAAPPPPIQPQPGVTPPEPPTATGLPRQPPGPPAAFPEPPRANVFCPTGPGGGVDATCSPGGAASATPPGALDPEATRQTNAFLVEANSGETVKRTLEGRDALREILLRTDLSAKQKAVLVRGHAKEIQTSLAEHLTREAAAAAPVVAAATGRDAEAVRQALEKRAAGMATDLAQVARDRALETLKDDRFREAVGGMRRGDPGATLDAKIMTEAGTDVTGRHLQGAFTRSFNTSKLISGADGWKTGPALDAVEKSMLGVARTPLVRAVSDHAIGSSGRTPPGWILLNLPFAGDKSLRANVFCPTGEGGGVDAGCSPGGGSDSPKGHNQSLALRLEEHVTERPAHPMFHDPERKAVEENVGQIMAGARTHYKGGISHTYHPRWGTTTIWKGDTRVADIHGRGGNVRVMANDAYPNADGTFGIKVSRDTPSDDLRLRHELGLKIPKEAKDAFVAEVRDRRRADLKAIRAASTPGAPVA